MIGIELLTSEERNLYNKRLKSVFLKPDSPPTHNGKKDKMRRLFDEAVLRYFTEKGAIDIAGNINVHNMDDELLHEFAGASLRDVAGTLSLDELRDVGGWLGKEIVKKYGSIFHRVLSNRNLPWDSPQAFHLAEIAGKHRLGNGKY